jgi:hypothetical protein
LPAIQQAEVKHLRVQGLPAIRACKIRYFDWREWKLHSKIRKKESNRMNLIKEIVSLHRHWVRADAIRQCIVNEIPNNKEATTPNEFSWEDLAKLQSTAFKMECYYALIYVVIEAYTDTKKMPRHDDLDLLLNNSEMVDSLRRFRNAIFHYQKDPIPSKWFEFMEKPDSENWIREIHSSFEKYLMDNLPILETAEHYGTSQNKN